MKWAVGETVDGEDVQAVCRQERLELVELTTVSGERLGSDIGKPEADAHGRGWRNLALDVRQMAIERRARIGPGFASIDVGAIGKMRGARSLAEFHDAVRRALSQPIA